MVQEVGMREAWLDFAASGANLPFELADRQGRFDDMMQMLGGGQDADEKKNQMRGYLLFHMRMTRVWCGPWAIERHKPFMDVHATVRRGPWVAAARLMSCSEGVGGLCQTRRYVEPLHRTVLVLSRPARPPRPPLSKTSVLRKRREDGHYLFPWDGGFQKGWSRWSRWSGGL